MTAETHEVLRRDDVQLVDGPRLAVRVADGPLRPFLLVHGLSSNALVWAGVGRRLVAAGHPVMAVDLRGHGESEAPAAGYDTDTCADDLAELLELIGWTGGRTPVVAGQSWGGNVVMSLAARRAGVAAVCAVDGGWLRPAAAFATFEECWRALAPQALDAARFGDVAARTAGMHPDWPPEGVAGTLGSLRELPDGGVAARLSLEHHREIVRSLYDGDPRAWFPLISVPVLLCPATAGDADDREAVPEAVREALAALPDGRVAVYPGADHELHVQHPARLARDLLDLAVAAEPRADEEGSW